MLVYLDILQTSLITAYQLAEQQGSES